MQSTLVFLSNFKNIQTFGAQFFCFRRVFCAILAFGSRLGLRVFFFFCRFPACVQSDRLGSCKTRVKNEENFVKKLFEGQKCLAHKGFVVPHPSCAASTDLLDRFLKVH
jgi:hypothetical protein